MGDVAMERIVNELVHAQDAYQRLNRDHLSLFFATYGFFCRW